MNYATNENWNVKVTVWNGTRQQEHFATGYAEAMKIVEKYHSNAYSPRFEDRDGNDLVDCGSGLCTEEEAAKPSPTMTA